MMSSEDVSTDRLTQKPWPPPSVSSGPEQLAVVVAGDGLVDEADAAVVQQLAVLVLGIDDHETGFVIIEMTLDQRQRAFADRAEADHDNRAGDAGVNGPFGHMPSLQQQYAGDICGNAETEETPRIFSAASPIFVFRG